MEDFCSSIEDFIRYTFNADPYKKVIDDFNQYLLKKINYQIDFTIILRSYSLDYLSIMPLADEYISEIYKGKKLQQVDKFDKCAIIVNILYAMLLANYVASIRNNFDEYSQDASYLWRLTYEIGFLQGEMCLIQSHLDADMKMIHRSSASSQEKMKGLQIKHKQMEERDRMRDRLYEEPLKYAEEKWGIRNRITYHNIMADEILEKFDKSGIDRTILIEKLKPIARGYRYSNFCGGEFKSKSDIEILCIAINADKYSIKLKHIENSLDRLNEIIRTPDFYSKWFKKRGELDLPQGINELVEDTHDYRNKQFSELTEEEQGKIKRLNRLLLEHSYPLMTPKSLPRGLMRGPEGKKEQFDTSY